jgi:hypothetical protein
LGRVIRDIRRKIAGDPALQARFADLLALAQRVPVQDHRRRYHGPRYPGVRHGSSSIRGTASASISLSARSRSVQISAFREVGTARPRRHAATRAASPGGSNNSMRT